MIVCFSLGITFQIQTHPHQRRRMRTFPIGQSMFVMNFKPILAQEAGFVRILVGKEKPRKSSGFLQEKRRVCQFYYNFRLRTEQRGRGDSARKKRGNLKSVPESKLIWEIYL